MSICVISYHRLDQGREKKKGKKNETTEKNKIWQTKKNEDKAHKKVLDFR